VYPAPDDGTDKKQLFLQLENIKLNVDYFEGNKNRIQGHLG